MKETALRLVKDHSTTARNESLTRHKDILHVEDTFATDAVHLRATATFISALGAG